MGSEDDELYVKVLNRLSCDVTEAHSGRDAIRSSVGDASKSVEHKKDEHQCYSESTR
jgi:hypothetical protein